MYELLRYPYAPYVVVVIIAVLTVVLPIAFEGFHYWMTKKRAMKALTKSLVRERLESFNLDSILSDPDCITVVADAYAEKIGNILSHRSDRIAFVESDTARIGALWMLSLLTVMTRIPAVVVRPRKHIDAFRVSGKLGTGAKTLIVADAAEDGRALCQAVAILKERGAKVIGALVFVDQEQGAAEALSELGVELMVMHRLSTAPQEDPVPVPA